MSDFVSTPETQNARLVSERAQLLRTVESKVGAELKRVAQIEETLKGSLPQGKSTFKTPAGEVSVTKSANRRIDKDVAGAQLRPGQFQRVSVRVLDTTMLRKSYPEIAAAATKDYGWKLSF